MEELTIKNSKKVGAHYSAGIVDSKATVYVSGQLPINPITREKCEGGVYEQTLMALENIESVLKEKNGSRKDILRTTAYVSDMDYWEDVNKAYSDFFDEKKTARTIVCVPAIHFNLLVEIEAIAEI